MLQFFDLFTAAFFSIFIFIINIVVAVHILINKNEEPVSSLLWLFVVFSLPGFGIFCYLLFGINRIHTIGVRIKKVNELLVSEKKSPESTSIRDYFEQQKKYIFLPAEEHHNNFHFGKMLDRLLPDTVPLIGNNVELLHNGNRAYPKMIEAIENAQSSIHLQSYIIMDDKIGKLIFETLLKKAGEGVKVKVLYDKLGSWKAIFSHFFNKYSQAIPNMEIKPFTHANLLTPWRVQLRNHRKLLVIDGKVAFVGGINISSENIVRRRFADRYIHDLHCMIKGAAVGEFQFSFLRDWAYSTRSDPSTLLISNFFPKQQSYGDSIVRVISSGPGQNYEASQKMFLTAVSTAKDYIWLITPYFIPDKPFLVALCMAVARGVDVRIIVPKTNNHWYVHYATKGLYRQLLRQGVRIFEKGGSFSHAKAILIDGEWSCMGSSNCDNRSFRLNYELDFVVSRGVFMNQIHAQMLSEFNESKEVEYKNIMHKKIYLELLENICLLLTPIL